MERVMIVEDHSAFAQALELILGQVEVALANLFPQTPRRIRQLASRAADTGSASSLPLRTNCRSITDGTGKETPSCPPGRTSYASRVVFPARNHYVTGAAIGEKTAHREVTAGWLSLKRSRG